MLDKDVISQMYDETYRVGITAGVFDLLHSGHVLMMQYAKARCDYLIVAVQVDPSQHREGKEKPAETIYERFVRLSSCKWVDKVIPYETEEDLEAILSTTEYDIRFIGADHEGKTFTGDSIKPETFHFNPREHNYSSSNLKKRIREGGFKISKRTFPDAAHGSFTYIDDLEMDSLPKEQWMTAKMTKERKKDKNKK